MAYKRYTIEIIARVGAAVRRNVGFRVVALVGDAVGRNVGLGVGAKVGRLEDDNDLKF